MGVVKSTIIVEDRLKEMFDTLPAFENNGVSFSPIFRYGDNKELQAFLKAQKGVGKKPYPLIWLVYPYTEQHTRTGVDVTNMTLVLAVDTDMAMFNPERMEKTYKTILFPLWDNIKKLFNLSNTIDVNEIYQLLKFPNYSENENGEAQQVYIAWDALQITFNCSINDYCLNEIIY